MQRKGTKKNVIKKGDQVDAWYEGSDEKGAFIAATIVGIDAKKGEYHVRYKDGHEITDIKLCDLQVIYAHFHTYPFTLLLPN